MGFPAGWSSPPHGHYNAEDVDSLRYEALGNAVTPPVILWLASRIKDYLLAPANSALELEAKCG
jgi:DNA (cytosine-5)-methyltransferase 1